MWTCPKCGARVDPSFDVCWQCGTSREGVEDPGFVPADQAGPIPDEVLAKGSEAPEVVASDASSELVEAYQALSLMEAKFLADELNAQGIRAVSDEQDMQDALGPWDGNPRVYVQAEDLPRARAWLQDYEQRRARNHPNPNE